MKKSGNRNPLFSRLKAGSIWLFGRKLVSFMLKKPRLMMKSIIVLFAATAITACGGPARQAGKETEKQTEKTVLCGGYTQQRPLTEAETDLFRKVTHGMTGVSYTPQSVATQVVAGTNYRFVCTAKTATRNPETYQAEVIVYQPLPGQGEAKITSIKRL